ncbi:DNA/RNA helicase domain-containing protein [Micromonospora zamorensis]|uniref:DNA/RNA helicase domain-containing protein n=1 Tax=Micromonospora zamorensis TaxID=709883 RepID=UPI0033DD89FC
MAYELVMHAVERARTANHKRAVVVAGGPGSGKSVIALSVLGELARRNRPVLHATGSRSFTQTLRRYAGRGSTRLQSLFKYFNSFMDAEPNDVEVLICDEAHRVRENSVNRYTPKARRDVARPQLEELILHDQFRCGVSEAYEDWVLDLLGLDGGEPSVWTGDGRFDVRVAGSPEELEAYLAERQAVSGTARMSAGYCWPWSDPRPDGTLVPDVTIGDWARQSNVRSERSVGEAPGSAFWATDPNGFGQIGCVYTAQGFEYDWSGVIIGPDLVARDGRLVTRREESKDSSIRSRRSVGDAEVDRLIRNTYKVLLTRGMRGTVLYATDPETQDFLRDLVRVRRAPEIEFEDEAG